MINMYTPSVFKDNLSIKAFLHQYCADNDAKSMVKHLIFLQQGQQTLVAWYKGDKGNKGN